MRSALVTGASTGIGRATALRLDAHGWRVFASVRRDDDAEALRATGSERLTPLRLDITEATQIAAAAERIGEELGAAGLDGLVNNAGVLIPSPLETMPIDDFRRQIEVSLTGQVAVTQAMLPAIREARGRIAFVGSICGRIAFPLTGAYDAAKFGLAAVGDVFRQELRPWGISVSLVEPGLIDTPIRERGDRAFQEIGVRVPAQGELYARPVSRMGKLTRDLAGRGTPPSKVAAAVEHALSADRPRTHYLVGFDAKAQARVKSVLPARALDRLLARLTAI